MGGSVFAMFHLDYLSCFFTILATILLARNSWIGLLVAIANSLIVCGIGLRTSQLGLIPANLFALAYTRSACGRGLRNEHTRTEIRRSDRNHWSYLPIMVRLKKGAIVTLQIITPKVNICN